MPGKCEENLPAPLKADAQDPLTRLARLGPPRSPLVASQRCWTSASALPNDVCASNPSPGENPWPDELSRVVDQPVSDTGKTGAPHWPVHCGGCGKSSGGDVSMSKWSIDAGQGASTKRCTRDHGRFLGG